jgi:phenylacetic acid degradation operon negative regulatory protein
MSPARDPLAAALETLLRRYRSQRPLRGGSLLVSIFGDAIAPRGGAVTLGSLIELARPFGLAERLVRTAVGRLAAQGWLEASRLGRRSEYRLTENGRTPFAEATRRIYAVQPLAWDGGWTLAVLTPAARGSRRMLRQKLRWLGFGPLAPWVYAHPACSLEEARGWLATLGCAEDTWLLSSRTEALDRDRRLAAEGWNLGELARRYRRFRDTFAPVAAAVAAAQALPARSAFVIRTLLIHEYRRIHLKDPLLPAPLLPEGWIGAEAYELCRRLYAAVLPAAEQFLSDTAATLHAPLPPPTPAVYARFGGIAAAAPAPERSGITRYWAPSSARSRPRALRR